jgi:uncharacterized membrane protein
MLFVEVVISVNGRRIKDVITLKASARNSPSLVVVHTIESVIGVGAVSRGISGNIRTVVGERVGSIRAVAEIVKSWEESSGVFADVTSTFRSSTISASGLAHLIAEHVEGFLLLIIDAGFLNEITTKVSSPSERIGKRVISHIPA